MNIDLLIDFLEDIKDTHGNFEVVCKTPFGDKFCIEVVIGDKDTKRATIYLGFLKEEE